MVPSPPTLSYMNFPEEPDFIGDALEDDAVRERIVKAADMALVSKGSGH